VWWALFIGLTPNMYKYEFRHKYHTYKVWVIYLSSFVVECKNVKMLWTTDSWYPKLICLWTGELEIKSSIKNISKSATQKRTCCTMILKRMQLTSLE
jgi:hypothetical protein